MRWRYASLLLLAACATAGEPAPSTPSIVSLDSDGRRSIRVEATSAERPNVTVVPATPVQVWEALPGVFEELKIGGGPVDAAALTYGQKNFSVRRRLADAPVSQSLECGASVAGVANANSYTVTLSVVTGVQAEAEGGSGVTTWIEAFAQAPGRSDHPVRCGSTGSLERRIAASLMRRFLPTR